MVSVSSPSYAPLWCAETTPSSIADRIRRAGRTIRNIRCDLNRLIIGQIALGGSAFQCRCDCADCAQQLGTTGVDMYGLFGQSYSVLSGFEEDRTDESSRTGDFSESSEYRPDMRLREIYRRPRTRDDRRVRAGDDARCSRGGIVKLSCLVAFSPPFATFKSSIPGLAPSESVPKTVEFCST